MNIFQYVFKKTTLHWLCMNPISKNWFICRQKEPLIIVEFNPDSQTGKIVGIGKDLGRKIENCKQYEKELKRAVAFTKAYMKKRQIGSQ